MVVIAVVENADDANIAIVGSFKRLDERLAGRPTTDNGGQAGERAPRSFDAHESKKCEAARKKGADAEKVEHHKPRTKAGTADFDEPQRAVGKKEGERPCE